MDPEPPSETAVELMFLDPPLTRPENQEEDVEVADLGDPAEEEFIERKGLLGTSSIELLMALLFAVLLVILGE